MVRRFTDKLSTTNCFEEEDADPEVAAEAGAGAEAETEEGVELVAGAGEEGGGSEVEEGEGSIAGLEGVIGAGVGADGTCSVLELAAPSPFFAAAAAFWRSMRSNILRAAAFRAEEEPAPADGPAEGLVGSARVEAAEVEVGAGEGFGGGVMARLGATGDAD